MTQPALQDALVARLSHVLARPVRTCLQPTELRDRDLIGGVVALRGTWWGVVIVRCDRGLASSVARPPETTDTVMRWLAEELAAVAQPFLDPEAVQRRAVALDGEDATWRPAFAVLCERIEISAGDWLVLVEIHRRRRSDELPAAQA